MITNAPRQRAPSARSLETRGRILDAAEQVFASKGFDAATLREIASLAGVPVGLVHHHGPGKQGLIRLAVARRADALAGLRIAALDARKAMGPLDVPAILDCFFGPFLRLSDTGGPGWTAYARLVAHVSADPARAAISRAHFDPTAARFIDEIAALFPAAPRARVAAGFVYSVSAMLALLTSRWRIAALADGPAAAPADHLGELTAFCAAGLAASLGQSVSRMT